MEQLYVAEDHPSDERHDHDADAGIEPAQRLHRRLRHADAWCFDLYTPDRNRVLLLPEELHGRYHRSSEVNLSMLPDTQNQINRKFLFWLKQKAKRFIKIHLMENENSPAARYAVPVGGVFYCWSFGSEISAVLLRKKVIHV